MQKTTKSYIDGYDFFGYLMPGAFLMFTIVVAVIILNSISLQEIYETTKNLKSVFYVSGLTLFIMASYILGHVIATFSAIFLDRVFIHKIFGYPYVGILFPESTVRYARSNNFYRTIAMLSFLSALFFTLSAIIINIYDNKIINISETFFSLCIIFILIKWLDELFTYIENKFKKDHNSIYIFTKFRSILNFTIRYTSVPFRLLENIIRKFMGLDNSLSKVSIDRFKEKYKLCFKTEASIDNKSDIYWLTYWYVVENSEHSKGVLLKFLALYGLMRNLSFSFFMSSLILVCPLTISQNYQYLKAAPLFLLLLSVLVSVRYYYLYYNYYSKSVFRSFLSLKDQ